MASKWSGLAPAVNAHLHRWQKSDAEWQKVQRHFQRESKRSDSGPISIALTHDRYPLAYMWSIFARTWGLPTADGSVITQAVPMEGMTINGREQFVSTAASEKNGMGLMEREHRMLERAETVYVSSDIVDRINYASQSIDPEPLFATDLFAPCGLIVLEKPIKVPDYHPGTGIMTDFIHVGIRAIGWTPERIAVPTPEFDRDRDSEGELERMPGTMIYTYTTNEDWKNTYAAEVDRAIKDGKIRPEEAARIFNPGTDQTISMPGVFSQDAAYTLGALSGRDHLVPSDVMAWAFGRNWSGREQIDYVPGTVDSSVSFLRRWFLTLMRFSWQEIVSPHRPPPSPKLARRMADAKRPNAPYSILRLRRRADQTFETGTGKRLTYRVKTRGHWRNVYVPTLGPARLEDGSYNPSSHRRQWIEAFWRGPIDGPLGPEHKATVIVR